MGVRIGINGFGRIGRVTFRQLGHFPQITVVGINDVAPVETLAHLLKYDSIHGRYAGEVSYTEEGLKINGRAIPICNQKEPEAIPWKELGADLVLECSGRFTEAEKASGHINAGAKRVIISAPAKGPPAKGPDATFVYGINHESYDPSKHRVVSNASCTTNCLVPIVFLLHRHFGIEKGLMTTIHSYTNDQMILDAPHKDLRRARAAASNQIPTTTGAAKSVGEVLPELKGKLDGLAIRVPTTNVSCVDFVALLKKAVTKEALLSVFREGAAGALKGILGLEEASLVSSDFLGDPRSCIVDAPSSMSIGNLAKVIAWYDNEVAFSRRLLDLATWIGSRES